jgi:hypothetical protein
MKGIKLGNGQTKIMNLPLEIMNLNEKSKPHGRIMAAASLLSRKLATSLIEFRRLIVI